MSNTLNAYKCICLGPAAVGKSSVATRFVEDEFTEDTVTTVGVEYLKTETQIEDGGPTVTLQIWDSAGQERYRAVSRTLIAGSRGCMLVYDITRMSSFEEINTQWLPDVRNILPENTPIFLIGNKCDLASQRAVPTDQADAFAKKNGLIFLETSAKDKTNINKAFQWLAKEIYNIEQKRQRDSTAASSSQAAPGAARVNPSAAGGAGGDGSAAAAGAKVDLSKGGAKPADGSGGGGKCGKC